MVIGKKHLIGAMACVCMPFASLFAQHALKPIPGADKDTVFTWVDEKASFPGGAVAWDNFFVKNHKYPKAAKDAGLQTAVILRFIVHKDGAISNPEVVCSCHPLLTDEAMRLVKLMPKWNPAKKDGKACDSYVKFPFIFKLKEMPAERYIRKYRGMKN